MNAVRLLLRRLSGWWLLVPEPRAISILTGCSYLALFLTGVVTLLYPPRTLVGAIGGLTMELTGWFLVIGAIVGVIGGTSDFWQLERVGTVGMIIGLSSYGLLILGLQLSVSGSRLTQFGVIVVALLSLLTRRARIWRYPFKPRE